MKGILIRGFVERRNVPCDGSRFSLGIGDLKRTWKFDVRCKYSKIVTFTNAIARPLWTRELPRPHAVLRVNQDCHLRPKSQYQGKYQGQVAGSRVQILEIATSVPSALKAAH